MEEVEFRETLRLQRLAQGLAEKDRNIFESYLWQDRLSPVPASIKTSGDLRDYLRVRKALEEKEVDHEQTCWDSFWGEFFLPDICGSVAASSPKFEFGDVCSYQSFAELTTSSETNHETSSSLSTPTNYVREKGRDSGDKWKFIFDHVADWCQGPTMEYSNPTHEDSDKAHR